MPAAESVSVLTTEPTTLPVMVTLATSCVVIADPEIAFVPIARPKTSALCDAKTLTTVLFVTCAPSSNATQTPARPSAAVPAPPRVLPVTTVPKFLAALCEPTETTPNWSCLMLLFWTRLLSFRVPRVDVPIVVLPKPTPANVVVLALPDRLRFLIVSLVVGSAVVTVWPQMTALEVPALVLLIVVSRVEPPELDPSMVT